MRMLSGSIVVLAAALLASAVVIGQSFGNRNTDMPVVAMWLAVFLAAAGLCFLLTGPRDRGRPLEDHAVRRARNDPE